MMSKKIKSTTFFALHSLTNRNENVQVYDKELEQKGYYSKAIEKTLPIEERPSPKDRATGQIDLPLILKGEALAKHLADQIIESGCKIDKIYTGDQKRCRQTALIVAWHIFEKTGKKCNVIIDNSGKLDACGYGKIAEENKVIDELEHFWKYKFNPKNIALALTYVIAPKLIGADKKSDFRKRAYNFFNDINQNKMMTSLSCKTNYQDLYNYNKNYIDKREDFKAVETHQTFNFDNSLIIAGSDIWKILKNNSEVKTKYAGKNSGLELNRGQLANIELPKELKIENIVKKHKVPQLENERIL